MKQLAGKVGVITGGASGIGRALAEAFAEVGMDVVIGDVDVAGADAVANQLRQAGRRAVSVRTDVTQAEDVRGLLDATLEQMGRCDVMVNNAGVGYSAALLDTTDEQWQRTIDIDLWGVIHGSRVFGRYFRAQRHGHIVNVASCAGLWGVPGLGAYSTAKFGVVGLSQTLRWELAQDGVGVTVVCPGFVRTNLTEAAGQGHRGLAKVIARAPLPDKLAREIVDAIRGDRGELYYGREARGVRRIVGLPRPVRDRVSKWIAKKALARVASL